MDSINTIIAQTNFRQHPYEKKEKLKLVEAEIQQARANKKMPLTLFLEYGQNLLEAGESQAAINTFEEILTRLPENDQITQQTKNFFEIYALLKPENIK